MNNTVGERGKKSEAFASLLSSLLPACEIVLWDERCTTKSAIDILNTTNTRGKKRKNVIDTVAATLILQSFLDANRNQSL
jgi:putative Holliday junction resolvase